MRIDPNNELLRYGAVQDEDEVFVYNEDYMDEAVKRFSKDGVNPKGLPAVTHMLINYYLALREAVRSLEGKTQARA